MDMSAHDLNGLFAQLGLPSETSAIESFVRAHSPLASAVYLSEAPFWTPSQAAFLREEILRDADWAEIVDGLNGMLRH